MPSMISFSRLVGQAVIVFGRESSAFVFQFQKFNCPGSYFEHFKKIEVVFTAGKSSKV